VVQATRRGDALVVETDDERLRGALDELYFAREDGAHVRRFAARLDDAIYERFVACVEPLLRQTARLDPAPWPEALAEVATRLGGIDWWLAGSAALAVRGIDVAPRDLDLAAASLEQVSWRGFALRVPPLALPRTVSARRGLDDRVRLIDKLEDEVGGMR
jgi:hypothetical protein